jgi:hypothetical protein
MHAFAWSIAVVDWFKMDVTAAAAVVPDPRVRIQALLILGYTTRFIAWNISPNVARYT